MDTKVRTYKEARDYFDTHGFSFTAGSMRYLLNNKKSFAEVADISNEENCVYMLASAIPSNSKDDAIDIIYDFMRKGISIRLFHYMLKELAKEQDFFMSQTNLDIFKEISETAGLLESQDIANIVVQEMMMLGKGIYQPEQ